MFQFPPGRHKVLVRAQKHVEPYKRNTSFSHALQVLGRELLFVLVVRDRRIETLSTNRVAASFVCVNRSHRHGAVVLQATAPLRRWSAPIWRSVAVDNFMLYFIRSFWRPQQAQHPDFVILLVSAHSTFEAGHYKPPCIYAVSTVTHISSAP